MFVSDERTHQYAPVYLHEPLRGLKAAWGREWEECPEVAALSGPTSFIATWARLRGENSPNYWLRVQFRVSGKTGARKMQNRGNDRKILN